MKFCLHIVVWTLKCFQPSSLAQMLAHIIYMAVGVISVIALPNSYNFLCLYHSFGSLVSGSWQRFWPLKDQKMWLWGSPLPSL